MENSNGTLNLRLKTYKELSNKEKLQADCDFKATNIFLQGLPPDVYALVNHHKIAKDIWDKVKLLMQGTSLSRQEHECKLYDEFDKFSHVKGEALLPPEWGKFVTDVKLARDLHTSNYDQLYAYLEQHEAHANEAHLMRKRFLDPLALVANYHPQPYHTSTTTFFRHKPLLLEFPQIDLGLAVPTFLPGNDPIACMNKAMAFVLAVFTPCYPSNNNQLRYSSNPRNQATVQDGRVKEDKVRMLSV
ncbi:hypothetical protein Tco_0826855 [Tanacetum coccineum]